MLFNETLPGGLRKRSLFSFCECSRQGGNPGNRKCSFTRTMTTNDCLATELVKSNGMATLQRNTMSCSIVENNNQQVMDTQEHTQTNPNKLLTAPTSDKLPNGKLMLL